MIAPYLSECIKHQTLKHQTKNCQLSKQRWTTQDDKKCVDIQGGAAFGFLGMLFVCSGKNLGQHPQLSFYQQRWWCSTWTHRRFEHKRLQCAHSSKSIATRDPTTDSRHTVPRLYSSSGRTLVAGTSKRWICQ